MGKLSKLMRQILLEQEQGPNFLRLIFELIDSMPKKFILSTKHGDTFKLYPDGLSTAINNSKVTHFFLKRLKEDNRTTTVMRIPDMDTERLEKINNLIKMIDGSSRDGQGLFRAMCFQMMDLLVYSEYFHIPFRHGVPQEVVDEMQLPSNEEELNQLFQEWDDKDGKVRAILFTANSIPLISAIENY
jgi:hypothetical protein